MRTEWEVHTAVFIKIFHPELAKAEICHCVSYGKFLRSGPWEGGQHEEVLGSVWAEDLSVCPQRTADGRGVGCSCSSCEASCIGWLSGFPILLGRIICCWDDSGSLEEPLRGQTEALSLLGISGKLVLRQSLQKHVLLIDCQNVWSFFP